MKRYKLTIWIEDHALTRSFVTISEVYDRIRCIRESMLCLTDNTDYDTLILDLASLYIGAIECCYGNGYTVIAVEGVD